MKTHTTSTLKRANCTNYSKYFVSVVDNACKTKDGVNRNPCKNGAKCEFDNKNGEITCICPTSYEGPTCNGKAYYTYRNLQVKRAT